MLQTFNMYFPELPDSSRVWIYTSNRALTSEEQSQIKLKLNTFISEWAAHGSQLFGASDIIDDNFIVIAVDENHAGASGCSIDTSVRFVKDLGSQLNVDFFDRLNLVVKENDSITRVHISDLNNHLKGKVYNPMITSLGDLRNNWLVPVESSPFV